ncbi:MAG: hypothetical protein ACI8RD_010881, partial [Bacillariaceae sp.]
VWNAKKKPYLRAYFVTDKKGGISKKINQLMGKKQKT